MHRIISDEAPGLDCGPIRQFDAALVNNAPALDGAAETTFPCALGDGNTTHLAPDEERPGRGGEGCRFL